MSSRILLVTRLGSSFGVSGEIEGLAVADIRHADPVEAAISGIHSAGHRVVLTGGLEDAEDLQVIAGRAKVRVPGVSIAVEPLPGNPLALATVSSLASDFSDEPALLHAALDDLRDRIWSATWTRKLSQLTRPNPTVMQQMRSWMPSAAFLAEQTPRERVTAAHSTPLRLEALPDTTVLVHTPTDSWVVEAVRSALKSSSLSPMIPLRDFVDSYGTEQAIEFVAVPEDFETRVKALAESAIECTACGAQHARTTCPYCQMTTPVPTSTAPTSTAPQGVPQQ